METNVDVMTYAAAVGRGHGVLEAQYAAPMFAEGLVTGLVEVATVGPLTEEAQAAFTVRLAAFRAGKGK
jgi:hypothetical protein